MSIQPARFSGLLLVALSLAACGDDATDPSTDAATDDNRDAAADSGKPDAGHDSGPAELPDAGDKDAASSDKDAAPIGDDEQVVKLRFRAQVGDEPFACGRDYTNQGSSKLTVTPRDLRLFVQDVALLDADGKEVPVKLDKRDPWQTAEVALLDFEDATGECFANEETNREITGVVPKGEYRALRFSHGVPEKLNHSDPEMFPAPLQTPGMSWNWLLGLRFVKIELATQPSATDDLDAGADPGSFSLHVGSTACAGNQNAGTIKCGKPNRSRVELPDFKLGESEIVLDVAPLLRGNDLSQVIECHSGTASCEPLFEALGVSYATGKATEKQSVFRLE
jgi:uncharacterized repeat protein (TIGR04052 family)